MYRRGAEDAERGEPHPFFYQHYYHYRRGYDHARRRLSLAPGNLRALLWPASAVAIVLAIGGALWALLQNQQPVAEPVASTAIVAVVPTAALPTRTPIFPTATVLPTATPVVLRAGGLARVAGTGGRPLRGREEPSLDAPARVAFAEGEQVRVLEGPIEADGYVWWRIEGPSGAAWSAQGSPEGAEWLVPVVE
jgi:hypothetical protein